MTQGKSVSCKSYVQLCSPFLSILSWGTAIEVKRRESNGNELFRPKGDAVDFVVLNSWGASRWERFLLGISTDRSTILRN